MPILVKPDNTNPYMELVPGLWCPACFDLSEDEPELAHQVDATVVPVKETGLLSVTRLQVSQRPGGEPVTTASLRTAATAGKFVQACVPYLQTRIVDPETGHVTSVKTPEVDDSDVEHAKAHGTDDRTLRKVAHVYRIALIKEGTPTKSVAAGFDLSHATAGRWVTKARDAGFLGAVVRPGKAGVRPETARFGYDA